MFFFSWEARNGGIILTREPEIIIVTYMYAPWAPRHICCDVYIRPVEFKGLNCTFSFESYMILMTVGNPKTTIKNKVRAIKQKCVLYLVK